MILIILIQVALNPYSNRIRTASHPLPVLIRSTSHRLPNPFRFASRPLPDHIQTASRLHAIHVQNVSRTYPERFQITPNEQGQDARCISHGAIHPVFRPLGGVAPVAVSSGLRPETRSCWLQRPGQAGPHCTRKRIVSTPGQRAARSPGSDRSTKKNAGNAPTRRCRRLPR